MAATATASAAPRYAPEDPTLPKPWKGLVDGKTGYLYFWNPETNVTQYERPRHTVSSSVPVSSSVQVQQSSRTAYSPVKVEDRYARGNAGGSNSDAGTRTSQPARNGAEQSENALDGTANGTGGSSARASSTGGSSLSAEAYRRRHEISVTGAEVPPPLMSFDSTSFPPELLREVQNAGFSAPTPIQAQSWPIALQSRDIVAIAKTGSGKTLGYLVPGFMHLKRTRNNSQMGPTVLVLSPTRELATQIQDEAVKFGKSSRISCTCLYGGAPKGPQLKELDRGADIVVATPGRLNDILEMRRISLGQVSYLVLDEADRMLDMGFEPQIRKIVNEVPARRQTLMYTATWPKEVRKIAADLLVNPVQVNIGNVDELVANKSITQYVEVLAPMEKHRRLEQIIRSQEPGSKIIIFCSTKKMCDQLARNLTRQFGAAAIHGDKSQSERDHVLSQFRTGRSPVLVATDVAARGLDVKDIRVVVNYDFPTGVEDYVHRIGRTGRAGATGVAHTFFGDHDAKYASELIKVLEGANQKVPSEVREMASRGGGGGFGKFRRWGPSPGGRDGGRGGRSDFGYGGNDGGRGSFGMSNSYKGGGNESRDRYDRGYNDGSADKASGWGERSKNWSRDRSRSRSPDRSNAGRERSPVRSFHQAMMEKTRATAAAPHNQRERSRSPNGGGNFHKAMTERGESNREQGKGSTNGFGEEEEEGMIPADEDGN
ncbi:DEAD-box ATP-dependent RNA helicase 14 [Euphorbia peplus]|nr:DEAD-box ATP-dependent RNA helicase 14 [Euphorbia peplus]